MIVGESEKPKSYKIGTENQTHALVEEWDILGRRMTTRANAQVVIKIYN